jgi:hypothetical protein
MECIQEKNTRRATGGGAARSANTVFENLIICTSNNIMSNTGNYLKFQMSYC